MKPRSLASWNSRWPWLDNSIVLSLYGGRSKFFYRHDLTYSYPPELVKSVREYWRQHQLNLEYHLQARWSHIQVNPTWLDSVTELPGTCGGESGSHLTTNYMSTILLTQQLRFYTMKTDLLVPQKLLHERRLPSQRYSGSYASSVQEEVVGLQSPAFAWSYLS